MGDVIVIEDRLDEMCMRHVYFMSNSEFGDEWLKQYYAPHVHGTVEMSKEVGVWHLRAEWPYQGLLNVQAEGWTEAKTLVVWSFEGCVNVTEALMRATLCYQHTFERRPRYGFVRSLPWGVEAGREVGGLMVFGAEWMLEKCAAVGW